MKRDKFSELLNDLDRILGDDSAAVPSIPPVVTFPDDEDKEEMTVISALDRVVTNARQSGLISTFWREYDEEIDFLCKELEISPKEIVIIGVLSELGTPVSWRILAKFLGLSRLRAMSLTPEVDKLKEKRWVRPCIVRENNEKILGFCLSAGVVKALRNNHKFIPERLDGHSEQSFVDRLLKFFKNEGKKEEYTLNDRLQWIDEFCNANQQLRLCSTYCNLKENESKILLMLTVNDYGVCGGTPFEGLVSSDIEDWLDDGFGMDVILNELKNGTQELFALGIFEFGTDKGLADTSRWKLTSKAREELLGAYTPKMDIKNLLDRREDRGLLSCKNIVVKDLFYNTEERNQIERIAQIISKDSFDNVKNRLSECGFRCGICCLLYGAPGTGKTETVLQLARSTGRDIFQVNIAGLRDKYVGESEKNIKMVFERYKRLCQGCEHIPILLFNEADAIFGCRFENLSSSVEKMDNAIQNIILQEMETFEGILIATTNLTDNLDSAFDRRFLFKVEFSNPGIEARTEIWHSMLPEMNMEDCSVFAKEFNLSGGQIENVARKCKIEYVATGVHPDNAKIRSFCKEEHLHRRNTHRRVGF